MKKNIKNKVLAFTMASAMIVPNVAVVFAEAPKAGLAKASKVATDEKQTFKFTFRITNTETGEVIPAEIDLEAGQQTVDISGWLNLINAELSRDISYYGDFDYDATKFPVTVYEDGQGNVTDVYVTPKKAEEAKTYKYTFRITNTETGEVIPADIDLKEAGQQTVDISGWLNLMNAELSRDISYYGDFDYDATKFPVTVYEDGQGNVTDVYVTPKKAEEAKTYKYTFRIHNTETDEVIPGEMDLPAGQQTVDISGWLNIGNLELSKDVDYYSEFNYDATKFPVTVNEDGIANVVDIYASPKKAEEVKTYNYTINLIDEATNKKVADGELTFNAAGDQTFDITPILSHYGLKLANLDAYNDVDATKFPFTVYEDGEGNVKDIYVTEDISNTTTLHVTFATVDGTIVDENTFEKTTENDDDVVFGLGTDITLPAGYHWVDYNDQIKDVTLPAGATGGHYMYVEQDETQTVLNVTFETKDGEVVGTTSAAKEFTIDDEGVKVATFVVGEDFDLPEGYHYAEDVDQVSTITVNGTVGGHTVIVEKDEEPAPTPSEDPKKDDDNKQDTTPTATPEATATPAATATPEAKKEEVKSSKTANTADSSNIAAYAIPLAMSMIAIGAIVVSKKKLS